MVCKLDHPKDEDMKPDPDDVKKGHVVGDIFNPKSGRRA
jgi:hypothetical protein